MYFCCFCKIQNFEYNHENNFNLCIKANFFKLLRAFAPVLHNSCKKFGKNQYFCKDLCENIYFRKNLHKISYHNKLKNKSTFVKKFPTMLLISNSKKAKKTLVSTLPVVYWWSWQPTHHHHWIQTRPRLPLHSPGPHHCRPHPPGCPPRSPSTSLVHLWSGL